MASFILKFTLDGSKPPVIRTVSVPKESSFFDLHRTIQDAMGWTDIHLHEFIVGKQRKLIGPNMLNDVEDERNVPIADFKDEPIHYNYDFGDRWEVTVTWEGENDEIIPQLIDFQGVCPVDDSGGILGFQMIQKILADPKDSEYEETKKWMENYPPRTRDYAEFAISTYLTSGLMNDRKPVNSDVVGVMSQMFSLPSSGTLYLDLENAKVCELVDSVKQKSRFTKVTNGLLTSDPDRYVKFSFTFEGLDAVAEKLAPHFDVKKEKKIASVNDVISMSKEDKTEWMTFSITYYIKQILDENGLFIDYGYGGYNPVELSFRQLQNDPVALENMLDEFRDKE